MQDEVQSSLSSTARDLQPSSSSDYSGQPSSEFLPQSRVLDSESRLLVIFVDNAIYQFYLLFLLTKYHIPVL